MSEMFLFHSALLSAFWSLSTSPCWAYGPEMLCATVCPRHVSSCISAHVHGGLGACRGFTSRITTAAGLFLTTVMACPLPMDFSRCHIPPALSLGSMSWRPEDERKRPGKKLKKNLEEKKKGKDGIPSPRTAGYSRTSSQSRSNRTSISSSHLSHTAAAHFSIFYHILRPPILNESPLSPLLAQGI